MSENNETDQSAPYINSAKTKEEAEKDAELVFKRYQDFDVDNTLKDLTKLTVIDNLEKVASVPYLENSAKQKNCSKFERLSLNDYQEVCAYKSILNIERKLMALHALGRDDEAEKILPGFKKNFSNKIFKFMGDHVAIDGNDHKELENAIAKNFNNIYPDFIKDTETAWKEQHDFSKPEIQMKDNQFINLTKVKCYDVENAENQEYAYKFRKKYTDIVESAKNKEKVQENTQSTSKETDNSNTETSIKEKEKTAAVKRKQNTPQEQKTNKPVKEQMKNAAQQRKNQKKIGALCQENVAKNDNIPSRKQIIPVKNVENNKLRNLAEILKRKLKSSRTDR